MKNQADKIPCVVMIYYSFEIIKKTLDFLIEDDRFALYVIENPSEQTSRLIQPYCLQLLKENSIKKYLVFHQNISGNALGTFFEYDFIEEVNPYIMITDGDLFIEKRENLPDWLEEQIAIINRYSDIESCGINLSSINLPFNNPSFNDVNNPDLNVKNWIPDKNGIIHEDYVEVGTGIHFLLVKRQAFDNFIKWLKEKKLRFLDQQFRHYFKVVMGKKLAVTKYNYAIHLTWDLYQNPDDPYTKMKLTKGFDKIWKHFNYSYFDLYQKNGIRKTYYPWKAIKTKIKSFFLINPDNI